VQTCALPIYRHVDAAQLFRQRPWLQPLRLRLRWLARRGAHGLVPADVRRNDAADDAGADERERRTGRAEPPLVAALPRRDPAQLVARVRIDRLEDVPGCPRRSRGPGLQGVES